MRWMTMTIEVTVDNSGLMEIVDRFPGVVERAIELTATEVHGNIRQESPIDHGRLAGSWQLQELNPLAYGISSEVEYRFYVNDGTPAHDIEPKSAKALAFEVDGEMVFCKRVHHPGTHGTYYIDWAIDDAEGRIDEFADRSIQEVLGGVL
jgi:hypothetical protein